MSEVKLFQGNYIECYMLENSIAEVNFSAKNATVNKFNQATLDELSNVIKVIRSNKTLKGVLFSSSKEVFIVGADIMEFSSLFMLPKKDLETWLKSTHKIFNEIEDLAIPTVMAINGICLGGGFEVALSASYRVVSTKAVLGLPETKLGIYPGWGGTIRLPRLIGADNAIEWIASGKSYRPDEALKAGCVDSVVDPQLLKEASLKVLTSAIKGEFNWKMRRVQKNSPLELLNQVEGLMCFNSAKGFVAQKAGSFYPAPIAAINTIEKTSLLTRDQAIPTEVEGFIKLAKSSVAESLVTIFLSNQFNKKKNKQYSSSKQVKKAAVVGAGIMGGGIAYQSATNNVPILMKDINFSALDLGLNESVELLVKKFKYKKINEKQVAQAMALITPTLSYGDFKEVDIVVEAVVENEKVKKEVLKQLEQHTSDEVVIATNTSTIPISKLSQHLDRPQNFCGMHFFNPVYKMPLVEVIRSKETSDQTIGCVVNYALKMKKTPIVVNDCPGFLVNRVLFPYFFGLEGLLQDGVSFLKIDKVMERFGWPMGPSYLLDVIGIDTAVHASQIMADSYPDRMKRTGNSAIELLFKEGRHGQKNRKGFYSYTNDKKGKLKKMIDNAVEINLESIVKKNKTVSDEEIIERMMFPMIIESARALQEKIVDTPMEVDLGVIYGLGFPPFRGGVLKYADTYGLKEICEKSKRYTEHLGACYQPNALLLDLSKKNKTFY